MRDALHVMWTTLRLMWDEFALLVLLNLAVSLNAALCTLPILVQAELALGWRLGFSAALLLPIPPMLGALCFVTNQVAREKAVGWNTVLHGLRHYWAKSLAVALIFLLGLALILFNLWFYGNLQGVGWAPAMRLVWSALLAAWMVVQIFWFPMLLELQNESIRESLKDAFLLAALTPLFTLAVAFMAGLLLVLSLVLVIPGLLLAFALLALLGNVATRDRLAYVRRRRGSI